MNLNKHTKTSYLTTNFPKKLVKISKGYVQNSYGYNFKKFLEVYS